MASDYSKKTYINFICLFNLLICKIRFAPKGKACITMVLPKQEQLDLVIFIAFPIVLHCNLVIHNLLSKQGN